MERIVVKQQQKEDTDKNWIAFGTNIKSILNIGMILGWHEILMSFLGL